MEGLSNEVSERCGHTLSSTHGLPCACELRSYVDADVPISLGRIHVFWQTLVIGDPQSHGFDAASEDYQYFRGLVEQVEQCDPAVVRRVNVLLEDQLHPDRSTYYEPQVKTSVKGRPRGSTSTRRDPSAWEYSEKTATGRARGRGRREGASKISRESAQPMSTSSVRPMSTSAARSISPAVRSDTSGRTSSRRRTSDDLQNIDEIQRDIFQYGHRSKLPPWILDYVCGYVDVLPDGNCGFRSVASSLWGRQDLWLDARSQMVSELMARPHIYEPIYGDVQAAAERIAWEGDGCDSRHWLTTPYDLYVVAAVWRAHVVLFTPALMGCCSVLPLYVRGERARRPRRTIAIAHLDPYPHYIRVDLGDDSPLSPLDPLWRHHRDPSVAGWEAPYQSRIDQWLRLTNVSEPAYVCID